MTEPTRDALHVSPHDALAFLASLIEGHYAGDGGEFAIAREIQPRAVQVIRDVLAANAECVRKRAELEAEVERLRADLDDSLAQQGDIVGRLTAELDAINAAAADFYAEDASNLRAHPDIPWGIGGKSGSEHVAEWRNDLAERIERLLAAYAAATREGTDA